MKIHENLIKKLARFFDAAAAGPGSRRGLMEEIDKFISLIPESNLIRLYHESDERYRFLTENIFDVIWVLDLDLKIHYMSPSCLTLTGYTDKEIKDMNIESIITCESYNVAMRELLNELELEVAGNADQARTIYLDLEFNRKDGSTVWAESRITFLRESGTPVGFLGVTRDNSSRREAEEKLRRNEERYRTILETIEDGYYETDLSGRFVFFNNAFCKITGFPTEELRGMSYKQVIPEDSRNRVFAMFHDVFEREVPLAMASVGFTRRDDSGGHGELSVSLRHDPGGDKIGFCGIYRDTTEKMKMEEALRKSEESLRERNRVIEKDLLAAQLIQKSLLFTNLPMLDWVKVDYRYLPLDAVGGDYFSLTPLREGGLGVFIGDVSSHGVTAALFLSLVKATSERICRSHALMPAQYISMLNLELFGNMPLSFLTAIYGVFGMTENGRTNFTFTSAGHPYPLLFKAGTGEAEFIICRGKLIGVFNDLVYDEKRIVLEKGDRIFLYTDGVPETANENNDIIGYDRLPDMIRGAQDPSLNKTMDNIMEAVDRFKGNSALSDDIVILGFEAL